MAAASWLRYCYLAHFSRPKHVRQLYRLAKRHKFCRIVEVGITDLSRTLSLIAVAQRASGTGISYTGIDAFDTRSHPLAPLSLKDAYRELRATGASVRLAPGQPGAAIATAANAHQNTDLILIAASVLDSELSGSWYYLPRMIHERTLIFRERQDGDQASLQLLTHSQIAAWAGNGAVRRAA